MTDPKSDPKSKNDDYKKFEQAVNELKLNENGKKEIGEYMELLFDIWQGENVTIDKNTEDAKKFRLSYVMIWAAILLTRKYKDKKSVLFLTGTKYYMHQAHNAAISACNGVHELSLAVAGSMRNISWDIVFMHGGNWSYYFSKEKPPTQVIIQRFNDEPDFYYTGSVSCLGDHD